MQSKVPNNTKIHQPKVGMPKNIIKSTKNQKKKKKKRERESERERNNLSCVKKQ